MQSFGLELWKMRRIRQQTIYQTHSVLLWLWELPENVKQSIVSIEASSLKTTWLKWNYNYLSKFCFTFLKNLYDFPTNILVGKALTFFLTALTKIFSWETRRNSSSLILRISFKNIIVGNWKVMLPTTFLRLYFLWFSCHFPMRFPTISYVVRKSIENSFENLTNIFDEKFLRIVYEIYIL